MRLHFNLCKAVTETLEEIFHNGSYADKAIERKLKTDKRWGSRDRGFIAQTTYDIVRYFRYYQEIVGDPRDSITDWWDILAAYLFFKRIDLPDWEPFGKYDFQSWKKKAKELKEIRKFRESIPDWMDEIGEAELGDKWDETLHQLNQPAQLVLRANTLKAPKKELLQRLKLENINAESFKKEAVVLPQRKNVFRTQAFKDGLFEVQDFSSQQVGHFLKVQPGMRVVDACAGAGGKTLHLAALMQNKGQIIAMDTEQWKLAELKKRAKRAGAHIIERRHLDSTKVVKRLKETADKVLLDVPCSGMGVLRRNPGAKWKLNANFLQSVKEKQAEIINSYSQMVKKGGHLLYATCSILPSENEEQVTAFLKNHKDFELKDQRSILPQDEGFDGFFMALLERKS